MEITAKLNSYRQSPRKVRLVADLLRGKAVSDALVTLAVTVKRTSAPMMKLLKSAIANASHNHSLSADNLYIKRITVDQGQILKRSMPRARGSAFPIHKHTSHISLVIEDRDVKAQTPKPKTPKNSDTKASEAKKLRSY